MFSRIFKKKRPENEAIIDLAKLNALREKKETVEAASITSSNDSTPTDFLGTLAGAATSENANANVNNTSTDLEKMERICRRLERALERIDLIEHKIDRIERRTDLKY